MKDIVQVKKEQSSSEIRPQEEALPGQIMINTNSNDASVTNDGDGWSNANMFLSTDSSSDDEEDWGIVEGGPEKKPRILAPLPVGFLDPFDPEERRAMQLRHGNDDHGGGFLKITAAASVKEEPSMAVVERNNDEVAGRRKSGGVKQFWKAGDYEVGHDSTSISEAQIVGIEHVRVHPKFLHSNATSHKWALGAIAELMDNAVDEVPNGATYVHVDMLRNKHQTAMLMVEDNGGGMTPDEIRRCMSLGYSAKSQMENTIGQYGNGFKTSTMRLGADVIVFSRCQGKDKRSSTRSIGMLSYSFLTETGKTDIVVPMIDYEKRGNTWNMMIRSSQEDWNRNLDLIVQWSPYESEEDILGQFDNLKDQGTRIVIYNLWEDDEGLPELDFHSDKHDIQIRGVNRDEKKIQMAKSFTNLRYYLTYQHSLRHYAAILYLKIPSGFRIILRGKEVEHYNIENDLIHSEKITYRPQGGPGEAPRFSNMMASLHIGFIKDANYHLDVQGFNVYHKNRLIKPFWRVWNAAGSDGRGVIGILEANFVQPAHDKQGFEHTIVFTRLAARLVAIQKSFWSKNCHKVGYAQRVNLKRRVSSEEKASVCSKAQVCSDSRSNLRHKSKNHHRSPTEDEVKIFQQGGTLATPTQPQCLLNSEDELMAAALDDESSKMITKVEKDNYRLQESLDEVLLEVKHLKGENESLKNNLREERKQREITEDALREKLVVASDVIEELRDKVVQLERLQFRRKSS